MAEGRAFAEMLQDKNVSDKFELHRVEADSAGVEKAFKVDKEGVAQKTKMNSMAREVVEAIMHQTFTERCKWVESQRQQGNSLFK